MVIRSHDKHAVLDTASAVIDAVGGTGEAQKLTGRRTPQVVSNWRRQGQLPPDTFLIFQTELKARGLCAPPSLWGITATTARE